jgi:hypothetical protein
MEEACRAEGGSCEGEIADEMLFHCVPGWTNSIKLLKPCADESGRKGYVCVDEGEGKSDRCGYVDPKV